MTTDINLDDLSIEELEDLNHRIVERLKLLDTLKAHQNMMAFNLGEQVTFESSRHGRQFGTLIKFNQKTVVVLTEDKRQWRVPPHMLSPVKDVKPEQRFVYTNEITQE
jgi:imidazoleglycerol phosphate synthase glutamine amidotransferase subunit HisH